MVTITQTPIPQQKTSVISRDYAKGGGYTTYKDSSGRIIKRTYSGGGGRSARDIQKITEEQEAKIREEEARRLIEEKKRAEEEAKRLEEQRLRNIEMQKQIQSRTLGGQIGETIKPSYTDSKIEYSKKDLSPYGTPFVISPKEEQRIKEQGGTTLPYFTIESKNLREAIDVESKYLNVPVSTIGGTAITSTLFGKKILSTPEEQFNIRQIEQSKRFSRAELKYKRSEKDLLKTTKNIQSQFQTNPESFKGSLGFEKVETEKGTQYSLGESYFKNLPQYKTYEQDVLGFNKLTEQYTDEGFLKPEYEKELIKFAREKTSGDGAKLGLGRGLANVEVGSQKLVIGTGEGLINFGTQLSVQTFKLKDGKKQPSKKFSFDSDITKIPTEPSLYTKEIKIEDKKLFDIPTSPKYFSELVTERPSVSFRYGQTTGFILGGGAVLKQNIGNLGLKAGTLETASYLSPLRIQSGIYTPNLQKELRSTYKDSPELIKQVSFKQGDKTLSISGGKIKDINAYFESIQLSKGGSKSFKGASVTQFKNVPYFKYVGGELTQGTTTIDSTNIFTGTKVSLTSGFNIQGASAYRSDILERGINKFETFSTSKNLFQSKDISASVFAGGESVAGFQRKNPFFAEFEYRKGFLLDRKGVDITLNVPKFSGGDVKVFGGGKTTTSLSQTFQSPTSPQITAPKIDFISSQSSQVVPIITSKPDTKTTTQTITKTRLDTKTIGEDLKVSTQIVPKVSTKINTKYVTILKSSSKGTSSLFQPSKQLITPIQKPAQKTTTKPSFLQKSRLFNQNITTPSFNYGSNFNTGFGGVYLDIPKIPLFKTKKSKRQKSKQPTRYQPSFTAGVFKIKGKPKKKKGFGFLPFKIRGL